MRPQSFFAILLCLTLCTPLLCAPAAAASVYAARARVATYSISREELVRDSAGPCGADEYLSLVFTLTNTGSLPVQITDVYATIDRGERLAWSSFRLASQQSTNLHVYSHHMMALSAGWHRCALYVNGQEVAVESVNIPRSWNGVMSLPTSAEIRSANRAARDIAPYLAGWLDTEGAQFTEYAIDVKADYLPNGTYVNGGNWYFNYSELKRQYARVDVEVAGYGGLQKWGDGSTHAILSIWDVFCYDRSGRLVKTVRASQVYPPASKSETFGGEGTGVHVLPACPFEAGKWYRLLFTCTDSPDTGNTVATLYVTDLETGKRTRMAAFDLGTPNVCFSGEMAVFLENYLPEFCGEIRTAEYKNARIRLKNGTWRNVNRIYMLQDYDHAGSYRFGSDGSQFYMVTTGIGNRRQEAQTFSVTGQESGRPY